MRVCQGVWCLFFAAKIGRKNFIGHSVLISIICLFFLEVGGMISKFPWQVVFRRLATSCHIQYRWFGCNTAMASVQFLKCDTRSLGLYRRETSRVVQGSEPFLWNACIFTLWCLIMLSCEFLANLHCPSIPADWGSNMSQYSKSDSENLWHNCWILMNSSSALDLSLTELPSALSQESCFDGWELWQASGAWGRDTFWRGSFIHQWIFFTGLRAPVQ